MDGPPSDDGDDDDDYEDEEDDDNDDKLLLAKTHILMWRTALFEDPADHLCNFARIFFFTSPVIHSFNLTCVFPGANLSR